MNTTSLAICIFTTATTLCGCHSAKYTQPDMQPDLNPAQVQIVGETSTPAAALPKAVVYKMNGDYAAYVPVTVGDDGNSLISFPAPTDINDGSEPIAMARGYYLDRRGVNQNTRFTQWTYAEYRALKQTPSPAQILDNLIPDARAVDLHRLPITLNQALQDTTKVNDMIKLF